MWKISGDCPFVSIAHNGVGLLLVPLAAKRAALLFPLIITNCPHESVGTGPSPFSSCSDDAIGRLLYHHPPLLPGFLRTNSFCLQPSFNVFHIREETRTDYLAQKGASLPHHHSMIKPHSERLFKTLCNSQRTLFQFQTDSFNSELLRLLLVLARS